MYVWHCTLYFLLSTEALTSFLTCSFCTTPSCCCLYCSGDSPISTLYLLHTQHWACEYLFLSCAHIHSIDHPLVYCSLVKFNLQKGALLHQVIHSGKKFGPILLTGWEKGSGKWYYSSCSRGASCTRYFSEVELAIPNVTETAVYWTPYTAHSTDSAQCAQGVFCGTLVFVWFYCKLAVSYSKRFEHYNEPTLLWYSLCLEYCMENNQRAVKPGSSLILKAMRWGSDLSILDYSMLYFWFVNISWLLFTCSQATNSHL